MVLLGLAATAGIAASTLVVVPALATPGSAFGPPVAVSAGVFPPFRVNADKAAHWDLKLTSKDRTTVGVDKLVVQPGGYSGWHSHAGPTLVTVVSGRIIWQDGVGCSRKSYEAGDTFVEEANHVHNVLNQSGSPAEFIAIQMRPEGTGGRVDESQPPNCT